MCNLNVGGAFCYYMTTCTESADDTRLYEATYIQQRYYPDADITVLCRSMHAERAINLKKKKSY